MTKLGRALLLVPMLLAGTGAAAAAAVMGRAQNATAPTNATQQEDGLHSLMVKAGKLYFGTATDVRNLDDAQYQAILSNKNMFGMITAENAMKWSSLQTSPGTYSFTDADKIVANAKANGQQMRCHTLVYTQLPTFVEQASWTNETLIAAMQTHIKNVMQHYKGACYAWDVVIETLGDSADKRRRDTLWSRTIGPAYVPLAFAAAAEADPDAKLYYSDYNIELIPEKAADVVKIVQDVQARNIKIDGVGLEGHLVVYTTPTRTDIVTALKRFTDLGLDVAFTELDIRHASLPPSDGDLKAQAAAYVDVVGACLDVPRCVGITLWQFTDKYSWIPNALDGEGDALLWTADYKTKPAYDAVMALLRSATSNGSTTGTTDGESGAGRVAGGSSLLGGFLGTALLSAWLLL